MSRILRVAAAQMGPTQRADDRAQTLGRMIRLLEQAAARGAQLVVFPELAFTTFFPRWLLEPDALAGYFEPAMPNPAVQALFDRARALGVGFSVGYAEQTPDGRRFNSAILVQPNGGNTEDAALRQFHSRLVAQANAYMNATWAVAVAKAGDEDGSGLIGGSCIVDPNGVIVAEATTLADEVLVADCDLDLCRQGKDKMFNFAAHRRPEQYRAMTERAGVIEPE